MKQSRDWVEQKARMEPRWFLRSTQVEPSGKDGIMRRRFVQMCGKATGLVFVDHVTQVTQPQTFTRRNDSEGLGNWPGDQERVRGYLLSIPAENMAEKRSQMKVASTNICRSGRKGTEKTGKARPRECKWCSQRVVIRSLGNAECIPGYQGF